MDARKLYSFLFILLMFSISETTCQSIEMMLLPDQPAFIPRGNGVPNNLRIVMGGWFPNCVSCRCDEDDPAKDMIYLTDSMKITINDKEYKIEPGLSYSGWLQDDGFLLEESYYYPKPKMNGWSGPKQWAPHYVREDPEMIECLELNLSSKNIEQPIPDRKFKIHWQIWASICMGTNAADSRYAEGDIDVEIPKPDLAVWDEKTKPSSLFVQYSDFPTQHGYGAGAWNKGGPLWAAEGVEFFIRERACDDMVLGTNDKWIDTLITATIPDFVLLQNEAVSTFFILPTIYSDMKLRRFDTPWDYRVDPQNKYAESNEDNNFFTTHESAPFLNVQKTQPEHSGHLPYPFKYSTWFRDNNSFSSMLNEWRASGAATATRFHSGVDLLPGSNHEIYSVSSGFLETVYGDSANDKFLVYDDYMYGHMTNIPNTDTWGLGYFRYQG